jgi:glycosyltransferase involved in cell wall biosynthesis
VGDYTGKLVAALAQNEGVRVGVLTTSIVAREMAANVELIDVARTWSFFEFSKLINVIRSWKPDVVHIQYPTQGFFARKLPSVLPLACRLMGIKVVQTWHEPYRRGSLFNFLAQAMGANALIFVRPNYLAMLSPFFRKLAGRLPHAFIPNASALPVSSLDPNERLSRRSELVVDQKRLVVFFGFLYPSKGIEDLFDIANPETDFLIVAGAVKDEAYLQRLRNTAQSKGWGERQVRFTGFLRPHDAADLLMAADAVVLPFLNGGGEWNTSIHSALAQGTLVITTAETPRGDEPSRNLYTAAPSSVQEMRAALNQLAGRRIAPMSTEVFWGGIAAAHLSFYGQCL